MARPREFDADTALTQMRDAFWANGYEATSLTDLVRATGVQKASLYGAFGSKQDMYCKALVDYERNHVQTCVDMMAKERGRSALRALLFAPAHAVMEGDRRGCFLCNSSSESANLDADASAIAKRGRIVMLKAIETSLQDIQATQIQPGEILALYFGLRVLARSGTSEDILKSVAQASVARL